MTTNKKEWREFKYHYNNPIFLNFLLFEILSAKSTVVGTVLELIEMDNFREERNRFYKMSEEEFKIKLEEYSAFMLKLNQAGIVADKVIEFDCIYHEGKITEYGPHSLHSHKMLSHPSNLLAGRFAQVSFGGFEGEEKIKRLRETARILIDNNGYRIVNVRAGLNQRPYTSDHYYDGVDYDGHLFAAGGNFNISGYFPEDFDFRKLILKKLPESQKALECLVKIDKVV